jgi:hypothetical protein
MVLGLVDDDGEHGEHVGILHLPWALVVDTKNGVDDDEKDC